MKNIQKLFIIFSLMLGLTACNTNLETDNSDNDKPKVSTVTYSKEEEGVVSTLTFEYQEDTILKQTAVNEMNYEVTGYTKEQLQAAMEQLIDTYEGVDGVEYQIEYGDKASVETLSVDYEQADLEVIEALPGVAFNDESAADGISLSKTVELLEDEGYKEVKDKEK